MTTPPCAKRHRDDASPDYDDRASPGELGAFLLRAVPTTFSGAFGTSLTPTEAAYVLPLASVRGVFCLLAKSITVSLITGTFTVNFNGSGMMLPHRHIRENVGEFPLYYGKVRRHVRQLNVTGTQITAVETSTGVLYPFVVRNNNLRAMSPQELATASYRFAGRLNGKAVNTSVNSVTFDLALEENVIMRSDSVVGGPGAGSLLLGSEIQGPTPNSATHTFWLSETSTTSSYTTGSLPAIASPWGVPYHISFTMSSTVGAAATVTVQWIYALTDAVAAIPSVITSYAEGNLPAGGAPVNFEFHPPAVSLLEGVFVGALIFASSGSSPSTCSYSLSLSDADVKSLRNLFVARLFGYVGYTSVTSDGNVTTEVDIGQPTALSLLAQLSARCPLATQLDKAVSVSLA